MDNTKSHNENGNFEDIKKNMQEQNQAYFNGNDIDKQKHWNSIFISTFFGRTGLDLPLELSQYKISISYLEDDFDKFIPGIMNLLEEEGFTGEISDIFILDEDAIEFLEGIGYLQKEETKKKIIEIIGNKKSQEILGKNISFEELVERIGNLYYDSLSVFLDELGNNVYNEKASLSLKQASGNINEAWEVCKTKVNDFLIQVEKSSDKIEFKHTHDVKGLNIDNTELAKTISKLNDLEVSEFLEKLSQKIQKDGEADKGRGRIKLAGELFACAENLKKASDLL